MNSNHKESEEGPDGTIRLQVFIARAGVASRRGAVEVIEKGKIRVNGKTVFNAGARVNPAEDVITVDNRTIRMARNMVYLAVNKPPKYLCTNEDPEGRPLVKDLLRPIYTQRPPFRIFVGAKVFRWLIHS